MSERSELPAWGSEARGLAWLGHEVADHLWPWSRRGLREHRLLQLASLALAAAMSVLWMLAANGQVRGNPVIFGWLAWSLIEIAVRRQCKPWIKEGPWWGRHYRPAGLMDLVCYVSFKNLLVGAVLFVGLKSFGLLGV
jgi:hypothetical protein